VFYRDGEVLRGLDERACADWRSVCDTGLVARFIRDGWMVGAEELDEPAQPWAAVLRHEPVPFVSYPYEWCFDMLRDAALLQLDLLLAALEVDCTIQDASPFNVQWKGVSPVFIDVASLKPLAPGETWVAYRQFCQLFLYPLFLQAYRGVPFQPWLRGDLDGICPADCRRLLSARDLFRRGVFTHVYLHARAQASLGAGRRDVRTELRRAGFAKALIQHNVRRMRRLVSGLRASDRETQWSQYTRQHGYSAADEAAKIEFVQQVAARRAWPLVWDLGCNTGAYTRLVAPRAGTVVALDGDQRAVTRLYRALRADGVDNVLPLLADLTDPPPALGWRGRERKTLQERGRPHLTLCLALLHHAVIGGNVPLPEFVSWLAELGGELVIEFVTREDPMVQGMLRNRADQYTDYDLATFEHCLRREFRVLRSQVLCAGARRLYHAVALGDGGAGLCP
jgi:precorrin-6B methylase 2